MTVSITLVLRSQLGRSDIAISGTNGQPELFGNNTSDSNLFYRDPSLYSAAYHLPFWEAFNSVLYIGLDRWVTGTGNDAHSSVRNESNTFRKSLLKRSIKEL